MKKFIVVLLALIMCFGMTACSKDSPSDALKADLENAKSNPEELAEGMDEGFGEEAGKAFVEKMLDFDYKLGEEKVDGDTATVQATITTYPFGEIFTQVLTDYISQALADPNLSEDDINALMDSLMLEALKSAEKSYETTVDVTLKKGDDGWEVQEDDELANALTGGIYDLANTMAGGFEDLDDAA